MHFHAWSTCATWTGTQYWKKVHQVYINIIAMLYYQRMNCDLQMFSITQWELVEQTNITICVWSLPVGMKVVRILSVLPMTEKVRHSNGKAVSESGHLISVSIRTALVSVNSKLNFYDPNMMNITIRHKIYYPYPYTIREVRPRMKNYLYLYPQYLFIFYLFSSLLAVLPPAH
jgi:hypothetical protein